MAFIYKIKKGYYPLLEMETACMVRPEFSTALLQTR